MNTKFKKFPLGSIKVGGEIGHRMEITANKILDHLDIENLFAKHFRERREEPLVHGAFVGYGMLLDAIVKAAANGVGGERMMLLKNRLLSDLSATQSEDGNISIFSNKIGCWDNHEQAYIIIALVNDYSMHGNDSSLGSAIRLGDFLLKNKTGANIGVEQALLYLYEYSGDQRFLDYCLNELDLCCSMEDYNKLLPVNGTCHVYTYMARTYAQMELARIQGEYSYDLSVGIEELFQRIFNGGYASITGSCTGGYSWGELWDESQIGLGRWGETCATAYLLRNACSMLEFEGKSIYGDLFERAMYNALFAAQSPDGLKQRYFVPFNENGEWYEHETYCCPNNLRRIMFELPQGIFMQAEDGIAIILYEESSLQTEINQEDVTISLNKDSEDSDTISVNVSVDQPVDFAIYLRTPVWCDKFTVQDGSEQYFSNAGEFMKIRRVWNNGDVLKIRIPSELRLIRGFGAQHNKVAVMKGPIVYGVNPDNNQFHTRYLPLVTICGVENIDDDGKTISIPCEMREKHIQGEAGGISNIQFNKFSSTECFRIYFPYDKLVVDQILPDGLLQPLQ